MRFTVKEWPLIELYMKRNQIKFPIYQRKEVWSEGKNKLLIDSIFRGIDIPKLYLQYRVDNEGHEEWDCIDGHQRMKAIVGYFDGNFEYAGATFDVLSDPQKRVFEDYELTIAEVTEISDEEVRLLFQRLQLGIPLNSGEKLNSIMSNMTEFVNIMVECPFIQRLNMTTKRFAKEQVCAQICNNSEFISKINDFRNSKYEDLEVLYRVNKDFDLKSDSARKILQVLSILDEIFGERAAEITNRASAVSIYFLVEEMFIEKTLHGKEDLIRDFYLEFLIQLRHEVSAGIDARNRFLLLYQSRVIQAADSKAALIERHDRLNQAFEYYSSSREILFEGR